MSGSIKISKVLLAIVFSVVVFSVCSAHQRDDAGMFVSLVKKQQESPNNNFNKLLQLSDKINSYSIQEAEVFFSCLKDICLEISDERVNLYSNLMAGVYYLNHNEFNKALDYFCQAEGFSHEKKRNDYTHFLQAICYLRENNLSMIKISLEDIIEYDKLINDDFSSVIYCESLRLISFYYDHINRKDLVAETLDKYCDMSDTLVCSGVGSYKDYFPIPNFLQNKYFRRQVVDIYIKKNNKSPQKYPITETIILSTVFLLVIYLVFKLRTKKIIQLQNSTAQKQLSSDKYSTEFFNQSGNAVSMVGLDGKINWVNSGFEKLYGCTKDNFILSFGDNVFFSDKLQAKTAAIIKCRESMSAQNYTEKISTGFVNNLWIQGTVSPITENDCLTGFLIVETDITNIKLESQSGERIKIQLEGNLRSASDIQKVLMPKKAEISRHFDNFIIYRPKDYVSGDFYWFNKIGSSYIFALGDCIGHGLSGSLLCVLSMKTLEDIVLKDQISDPKEILSAMEDNIRQSLKQNSSGNHDCLDLTVCKITPTFSGAEITVSGAKSYFLYHSQKRTVMLRGSRRSVGGQIQFAEERGFENVSLSLTKGDFIYFSSDGIIDQNNEERKPLGRQRFFDIVDSAAKKSQSMSIQEEYIIEELEKFRNGQLQRDDICVAGIKI